MRYFMAIIAPPDFKPETMPQGLIDGMGPWMEKHLASGALISTGGLAPDSQGRRLLGQSGQVIPTDGPFAESKEVIGGYAVFEAPDLDAVTRIAEEFLRLHVDNDVNGFSVELRPIAGGANY